MHCKNSIKYFTASHKCHDAFKSIPLITLTFVKVEVLVLLNCSKSNIFLFLSHHAYGALLPVRPSSRTYLSLGVMLEPYALDVV